MASAAHNKKKSSRVKPVSIKVFLMSKSANFKTILPKGKKRQKLLDERKMQVVQLKRSMSPADVRNSIIRGFKDIDLKCLEYLKVDGGHLEVDENQSPGGEIVYRRGALYIREKDEEVSTVCYGILW